MENIKQEGKKITLGLILSWLVGIVFVITGLTLTPINLFGALLVLAAAAISLPPINNLIAQKLKISLSGGLKLVLVIGLGVAGIVIANPASVVEKTPETISDNQQAPVSSEPKATTNNQQAPASPKPTHPPAPVVAPKSYQQVFTLSGNGTKKSEPFRITGSRFKIKYDCSGDYCGAYLHKVGSSFPQIIMNTTGPTKDETIFYGAGEYYIEANTLGSFNMIVEDYR